jgi:hypothetical protein
MSKARENENSTSSAKRPWRRSLGDAFGIAFYAFLGLCVSALFPAINRTRLEQAQTTATCVLIGMAFGLLRAHWGDIVGPPETDPAESEAL